jgi:hypothetical protein
MPSVIAPGSRSTSRPPGPVRASEDEPKKLTPGAPFRAAFGNISRRPMAKHFHIPDHHIRPGTSMRHNAARGSSCRTFISMLNTVYACSARGRPDTSRGEYAPPRSFVRAKRLLSLLTHGRATQRVARGALSRCTTDSPETVGSLPTTNERAAQRPREATWPHAAARHQAGSRRQNGFLAAPRGDMNPHPTQANSPRWARLDSNQGPRPYQGRALTT